MSESEKSKVYADIHKDLIEACKQGSRTAQFRIYELYYKAMYNTAVRIVQDPDDAEDVMQEAFLKAFQKLDTFSGKVSFGAWLKRIVINKSLDFKKLRKETMSLDDYNGEIVIAEKEEEAIVRYSPEMIRKAIIELPDGYRIILSLFLLEGYDHEEIATIFNISNATSRTQYHRAKKRLIEILKGMNTE